LTLKPGKDNNAWIVRLFGASGEDRMARLHWSAPAPPQVWLSDLSEKPIERADQEIAVAGWDVVTLRTDRA
jgi:alpha-mannosidase